MFSVVTDTSHTAGLTMHATILAYMFTLVESEKVKNLFQIPDMINDHILPGVLPACNSLLMV